MKFLFILVFLLTSFSVFAQDLALQKSDRVNFADYTGTISKILSNGKAMVSVDQISGQEIVAPVSILGVSTECFYRLCIYDRVSFGDYTGTIKEIFSNGRAVVSVDQLKGDTIFVSTLIMRLMN